MSLTYSEQLFIELLQSYKSLSTFELQKRGFCTPNTVVHSLRKKGFRIGKVQRETVGHDGRLHPRVAHYSLGGSNHE